MERTRPTARPEPADDDLELPGLQARPAPLADRATPSPTDAAEAPSSDTASDTASGPETVAEADAREVWRVAARLQAEAARRLDARSQTLADEQRPAARPQAAFSRAEVDEIAQAAGIDPSFVALAWREVEAGRHQPPVSDDRQRRASAFLGTDAERLAVTRTFRAAPGAVLAAMQRVLPADPYRMSLVEILGESDAMTDSALLFDVPQILSQAMTTGHYTEFSRDMSVSDLTRVTVTLHDLGDGRTEATMAADLRHGKDRNLTVAAWMTAGVAVLGGVLAGLVGLAASGPAGAAMAAVLAAVLLGALMVLWYPAAYRKGLAKGERALADLLGAVDVDLRSGGAFRPPTPPPAAPGSGGLLVVG